MWEQLAALVPPKKRVTCVLVPPAALHVVILVYLSIDRRCPFSLRLLCFNVDAQNLGLQRKVPARLSDPVFPTVLG